MGIFTAAFLYTIGAMAWIDRVGSGRVPLLSGWPVVLLTLSSVAMFVCAAPTFTSACELDNEGNYHPVPCQKLNPNVLMMQPAEGIATISPRVWEHRKSGASFAKDRQQFHVFDPVHAISDIGKRLDVAGATGVLCPPILRFAPLFERTVVVARRQNSTLQ